MVEIKDKHNCCGCSACSQVCSKQCIMMTEDEEGFLYPKVDMSLCVDCGLCEKVCPMLAEQVLKGEKGLEKWSECDEEQGIVRRCKEPIEVFAVRSKNETQRIRSSSGGVFILLAENMIRMGGVVFGAKFDENWNVVHDYAETKEDLVPLMRSKYVQSRVGDSYIKAEQFLKQGREVMFVGTGCQIAGLKRFLRKDSENLLAVEIVCHGVPSPKVWQKNIAEEKSVNRLTEIKDINFREKEGFSWKNYGFSVDTANLKYSKPSWESPFLVGFWNDVFLRPSCAVCPAKEGRSGADIILGDFWGIENVMPEMNDQKGTSMVLVNTDKGAMAFAYLDVVKRESDYETAISCNPCLEKSSTPHVNRDKFFRSLNETNKNLGDLLSETYRLSIGQRLQLKWNNFRNKNQ